MHKGQLWREKMQSFPSFFCDDDVRHKTHKTFSAVDAAKPGKVLTHQSRLTTKLKGFAALNWCMFFTMPLSLNVERRGKQTAISAAYGNLFSAMLTNKL